MSLSYDHEVTASGLIVPQGATEKSVRDALKRFDRALMLDYARDDYWGCNVWQVLYRVNADLPPVVICRWREDPADPSSKPLPLSHGLVELARALHLNSRAPKPDAEVENMRIRERIRQDAADELEDYSKELVQRLKGTKSHMLPRGLRRRRTDFGNVTDIR